MNLSTRNILALYGITATSFFLIDLLWIAVVAKTFYANTIGGMLRDQVNWPAAVLFYLIYIGGIVLFVLIPALRNGTGLLQGAMLAGFLGLFAYGTFDLTALALFKEWPLIVTVVDMIWGAVLTAATASIALWTATNFLRPQS